MKRIDRFRHRSLKEVGIILITVVLAAGLGVMLYIDKKQTGEQAKYLQKKNQQLTQARNEDSQGGQESVQDGIQESFYQKLAHGYDVNILVIGDDIGALNWPNLVGQYVQDTYGVTANVNNLSLPGNASYAGYVQAMALADGVNYDLAIICSGNNDSTDDFAIYYEAIIRALRTKYTTGSIIAVMEASQPAYTAKCQVIQELAAYYGIALADMVAPFTDGTYGAYANLTENEGQPNEAGQNIYAGVIENLISGMVQANVGFDASEKESFNKEVDVFESLRGYNVVAFERTDDKTYTLKLDMPVENAVIGTDYAYEKGINACEIYADGKLLASPKIPYQGEESQRHIRYVKSGCTAIDEIVIKFVNAQQASGFQGIYFSGN